MNCSNCNAEMSSEAAACPACAHPNPEIEKKKKAKTTQNIAVVAMALGLLMVFLPIPYTVMFIVAPLAFATGGYAAVRGPGLVTRIGGGFALLLSLVGFGMIYDTHQKIAAVQDKLAEIKTAMESGGAALGASSGAPLATATAKADVDQPASADKVNMALAQTKLTVEEYFQVNDKLLASCSDIAGTASACTEGVSVSNGAITIDVAKIAGNAFAGKTIRLNPTANSTESSITWACKSSLEKPYRPSYCDPE